MDESRLSRWLTEFAHPGRETLLSFLDGELQGRRARAVSDHLAHCWACRQLEARLRQSIGTFVEHRQRFVSAPANQPPRDWQYFPLLLRQAVNRRVPQSRWRAFLCLWGPQGAAVALAALALGGLYLRFSYLQPVTAYEILTRMETAERQEVSPENKPVLRQSLDVVQLVSGRGQDPLSRLEIWQDLSTGETSVSPVADPILEPVLELVQQHCLPLSASALNNWRRSLVSKAESAERVRLPGGEWGWRVSVLNLSPRAGDGLLSLLLTVEGKTWRPLSQQVRIRFRGRTLAYRITRGARQFVSRHAFTEAVRRRTAPEAPPKTGVRSRQQKAAAATFPGWVSEPDLMRAEIRALRALHFLQALEQDSIELSQQDGAVVVRGVVASERRRLDILAALSGIEHLDLRIVTEEELQRRPLREPSGEDGESDLEKVASAPLPVRHLLLDALPPSARQTDAAAAVLAAAHRVLALSGGALNSYWILRRLAHRFGPSAAFPPDGESLATLDLLVRAYCVRSRASAEELHSLVRAWLRQAQAPEPDSAGTADGPAADWRQHCLAGHAVMQQADRLVRQLFAPSEEFNGPPESALARLAQLLGAAKSEADHAEAAWSSFASAVRARIPDSSSSHKTTQEQP